MIKVKNALIAAAALAGLATPSLAFAGKIGQELKELRNDVKETRADKRAFKDAYKSGNSGLTPAQYRTLLKQYYDQVEDTKDQIEDVRASR